MRLTDQKIRGLKCKSDGKPLELSDDGYPMSVIATRRTTSFYFRGRQDGKSLKKKIGSYPDISLSEARDHALLMKLRATQGKAARKPNPMPKILRAKDIRPTVNDIFAAYMKNEGSFKRDGGIRKWQRYENDVAPKIGKQKIADVTQDQLYDIVGEKLDEGYGQASNTLQSDLSIFFNWSMVNRRVSGLTENPMTYVKKRAKPHQRARYLSEQEIKWFFECLPAAGQEYSGAFESLLYTVCRKAEMTLTDLSERIGITIVNLSILKTGKARAIRFSTLAAICDALDCQPGDILEFTRDGAASGEPIEGEGGKPS